MSKAKRELHDIEPNEISLVGSPANRIKFLLLKSEEGGMDAVLDEIFKAKKPDGSYDYGYGNTAAKPTAEEQQMTEEVKNAIAVLKKYKDDLPDDLSKAIVTLISAAAAAGIQPVNKAEVPEAWQELLRNLSEIKDTLPKKIRELVETIMAVGEWQGTVTKSDAEDGIDHFPSIQFGNGAMLQPSEQQPDAESEDND